jgi:hypothetical protein
MRIRALACGVSLCLVASCAHLPPATPAEIAVVSAVLAEYKRVLLFSDMGGLVSLEPPDAIGSIRPSPEEERRSVPRELALAFQVSNREMAQIDCASLSATNVRCVSRRHSNGTSVARVGISLIGASALALLTWFGSAFAEWFLLERTGDRWQVIGRDSAAWVHTRCG